MQVREGGSGAAGALWGRDGAAWGGLGAGPAAGCLRGWGEPWGAAAGRGRAARGGRGRPPPAPLSARPCFLGASSPLSRQRPQRDPGPPRARGGERAAGAALGASPPCGGAAQGEGLIPRHVLLAQRRARSRGADSPRRLGALGFAGVPPAPIPRPSEGRGHCQGGSQKKRETVSPSQSPYGCWRSLEGRVATCRCLRARLVAAAQLHPWEVLPLSSWQPAGLKIMAFKNWKRRLMRSSVLLKI